MADNNQFAPFPLDHILNPVNPQAAPIVPAVTPAPVGASQKATQMLSAAAENNKAKVAAVSDAKKAALDGGYDRLAIAAQGENNVFNQNQFLLDSVVLPPAELSAKYGEAAVADQAQLTAARSRLEAEQNVDRTFAQAAGDTANAAGQGFVNSLGGLGALAAGAVNDKAGAKVTDLLNDFTEYSQGNQSWKMQRVREQNAIASDMDSADNKEQYEVDKQTDGETIAGLKRFGRDFVDSAARVVNSEEALTDLGGQAVGSLAAAAITGGPIRAAATPASKLLGEVGKKVVEHGSMSLAIGATEAGGAYTGTSQEINDMSDEDLMKGSDEYRRLRDGGMPEQDAKDRIRNKAGLEAAAIVAPVAAATGLLVSKFEANPFKVPTVKTAIGNVIRETAEEAPQSISGQTAQNVAIQANADRDRSLMNGLGQAGAEGAIGGALAAGTTQAPGTVYRGTAGAIMGTIDGVINMGAKVQEKNAQESPVATEKLVEAGKIESAKVEQIAQNLNELAAPKVDTPEKQNELDQYVSRIVSTSRITPEEVSTLPQVVQANLPETNDRFQTLITAASVAINEGVDIGDRFDAGLYVLNELKDNQAVFEQDLPAALRDMDPNLPEFQALDQYAQILNNINQSKEFQAVAKMINETMLEMSPEDITPQVVDNSVRLARHNPGSVNPEVNDQIMYQADKGDIQLSPMERSMLTASSSLVRAGREFYEALAALDAPEGTPTPTVEQVNKMITRKSDDETKPSLNEHMANIVEAVSVDQPEMAKLRATRLRNFAQHMQNKMTAMNMSYEQGGKPVYYDALMPDGITFKKSENPMVAYRNKENSIALAQQIYAEAKMASTLVNNVAETFPDIGIQKIKEPFISKGMRKVEPVVEAPAPKAEEPVAIEQTPVQDVLDEVVSTDTYELRESDAIQRKPKNESVDPAPVENKVSEEARTEVVEEVPSDERVEEQTQEPETAGEVDAGSVAAEPVIDDNAPVTLENLYPNLLKEGSKKNKFHEAFRLPENPTSRLVGQENPMEFLADTISNRASLLEVNKDVRYNYDDADARAYKRLLGYGDQILKTMKDRLRDNLLKNTKINGEQTTKLAALLSGDNDITEWLSGRVLNIVDPEQKSYNKALAEQAIAAGLHWMLNAEERSYPYDAAEIAKITGLEEAEVSTMQIGDASLIDAFNRGVSLTEAKRGLADLVRKFWGVEGNPDMGLGYVEGIPEGVAAELLYAMDQAGLIKLDSFKVPVTENGQLKNKPYPRVLFDTRDQNVSNVIDKVKGIPTVIGDAVLTERPDGISIGSPIENVPVKQMRNPLVDNTAQQRAAIKAAQEIPFYPNKLMIDAFKGMGTKAIFTLFGGVDLKDAKLNKNHEVSIRGKNQSIETSLKNLRNQLTQVNKYAETAGVEPTEMPTYYPHNMSRVGRLHMMGSSNPQADKIARELFVSTRTTLDLDNPVENDAFWMTVAQSLGVKTEIEYRADAIKEAQRRVAVDYAQSMEIARSLVKGEKMTAEQVQTMMNEFNGPLTVKAFHALLAVAQSEVTDNRSEFTHSLALEADGKTDGPINALQHFTAGPFSEHWITNMERGGLYLGSKDKTLNKFFHETGAKDLYQTATDALKSSLSALQSNLSADARKHYTALLEVMNELSGGDVKFTADGLELKRGVAKNPLTITVYGSGIDGIAGKISGALVDEFYIKLSDHIANGGKVSPKLVANLNTLMNSIVTKDGEGNYKVMTFKNAGSIDLGNYETATFTPDQLRNLRQNAKMLFVEPMHDAITLTMGDSIHTTGRVQKAIQVQSIVMASLFDKEVEARLAELPKKNDFLSQKQLAKIYKELAQYAPLIETGTQSFFVGSTDSGDVSGVRAFGKSIDDKMQTPAYVYRPQNAGVAGAPYMTIGPGDGQMVQNTLVSKDAPKGALYVFDGVELSAKNYEQDSRVINQAVFDGWMGNPVDKVATAFGHFLRAGAMDMLDDAAKLELKKALFGQDANGIDDATMLAEIESLNQKLRDEADQIEARHRAMERFDMTVDHMASAESPYVHSGQALPENLNDRISALNDAYTEELASIRGKKASDAVQKPDAEFIQTVQAAGYQDSDSGAYILDPVDLENMLVQNPSIEGANVKLLGELVEALNGQEYTIVVGSPSELDAYAESNHPDTYNPNEPSFYGKHDARNKVIYISNVTPETIMHELIHATTFNKVASFYANDGSLSAEDTNAIERLDGLMREWVNQSYTYEPRPAQEARQLAYSQVADALRRGQKDVALNEFMAWTLSNKALADVARDTKVLNPIYRIAKDALKFIKSLIWGKSIPSPDDKMYSNLEFNTRILLATEANPTQTLMDTIQYQSTEFGNNQRLVDLRDQFAQKMSALISKNPSIDSKVAKSVERRAMLNAQEIAAEFEVRGFKMNMLESSTFRMITAALATEANLNPSSLVRIQEIYADTMQKLAGSTELTSDQYNVLNGVYISKEDKLGRSALMPAFLALSMVSDDFRKILSKMDVPKAERDTSDSKLDRFLTNLGHDTMDRLATFMSGEGSNAQNVKNALDALTETLSANAEDQRTFFEKVTENTIGRGDQYVADALQTYSGLVARKAADVRDSTKNPIVKTLASFTRLMAGIVNNETAESISSGVTSAMNQMGVNVSVREFLAEIIGRTKENASVFDMVSKVRAAVQQTRQQFREQLPNKIAKQFSRPLEDAEWTALFKGIGKSDASSLRNVYDEDAVLRILSDDAFLISEIKSIENDLKVTEKSLFNKIQAKALDLASFMNTGKVSHNMLRNAYAVANLFGEGGRGSTSLASEQVVGQVDHLITLYSIRGLDADTKKLLSNLAKNEKKGVGFALSYLIGQRADEQSRLTTDAAKINHYKGFIPSELQTGTQFLVADDSEYERLVSRGFVRVADYVGSRAEGFANKKGYYQSPVSGRAAFNQGVLQNVRTTASGVDPKTGRTTQDLTAGFIHEPNEVDRIKKRYSQATSGVEALMPIYDENGNITAFERSLDPAKMQNVNRNTHLGQMIGAWRGRQVEEAMATEFNKALIGNLYKIWTEEKSSRSNEYIDLSKLKRSDDAVYHDAWSIISPEIREHIKEVFGGDGFPVRKDMLNDTVGYRSASVGDAWTGTSRWNESIQKNFQQAAMGIFGNDAYRYFMNAEKFVQNIVTDAKVLIVVKSVVVPMANLISNGYQLLNRGIPARLMFKGMSAKTVEINQFIKNRDREIEIEAELRSERASRKDARKITRLEAELRSIHDSNKRMTIYDLIEAGEFASITEGGVTQEDLALSEGKFANLMEKLADALPTPVQTIGRYAMVTKDTALFKGLGRAVQYGDFIAKAVLYDDLRKRKDLSKEEALGQVSEEFVNYNRLAGRSRQYLESIGMLWFWNFKIRSIKIARSMAVNNPLRSLMTAMSPGLPLIGDTGSPVTDNFLAVLANGKLGYSIGPNQGLNSFSLNPWVNLFR